jgi:hypothetical protein
MGIISAWATTLPAGSRTPTEKSRASRTTVE